MQAAGRRALSKRTPSLCAVVYLCYRLNEKGQLAPLSVYTFPPIWGKQQSLKVLPSSCACVRLEVCKWQKQEDQILFMIPFLAGSFWASLKTCWGLAFDLDSASEEELPDLCLTETDMKTDIWRRQSRDRDGKKEGAWERGEEEEEEEKQGDVSAYGKKEVSEVTGDSFWSLHFSQFYLSFGAGSALHLTSQSIVNSMNSPEQSYRRNKYQCLHTDPHLISLTQLPMNALLVAASSSIKCNALNEYYILGNSGNSSGGICLSLSVKLSWMLPIPASLKSFSGNKLWFNN